MGKSGRQSDFCLDLVYNLGLIENYFPMNAPIQEPHNGSVKYLAAACSRLAEKLSTVLKSTFLVSFTTASPALFPRFQAEQEAL